jgi:hypothetical protein
MVRYLTLNISLHIFPIVRGKGFMDELPAALDIYENTVHVEDYDFKLHIPLAMTHGGNL